MVSFDGLMESKRVILGLGLGQFVSLLITSTGFSSSELSRRGIAVPTSQSFLNYVLLAIVYGGYMIYRRRPLQMKWYYYLILGLVDVEANFLGGSNPVKGDMLVLAGATLYAVSNVSEEFLVKNGDRVEVMGMLGLFGAVVGACQISIFERNALKSIHWTAGAVLPFLGYAIAMFMFYSTVPVLLKLSGSTMLNLSLLTSDMWAVLIRIFAYHEKVDWIYFVAFAAVGVGLVIYSGGKNEDNTGTLMGEGGGNIEGKERDEEAPQDRLAEISNSCGNSSSRDEGKGHYYSLVSEER
ncbi:solute carrier family 35 member F2-like isoform X3 [Ananas comosus]|uniref:Solute carrier family 35 member F2-like isoform X3 n=1 Tax=Ananas comosus TaxID=4615 RepID=A0A6P5EI58_ANACO|nr:solute carrier family 35 member F2-like isoform X3 [Ananas comosus]